MYYILQHFLHAVKSIFFLVVGTVSSCVARLQLTRVLLLCMVVTLSWDQWTISCGHMTGMKSKFLSPSLTGI